MNTRNVVASVLAGLALAFSIGTFAHDGAQEKITILQDHPALNAPGKKVLMLTVDYLPGQASIPHSHAGTTMAYVLEGAIISKVNDGKETTYTPGQSWYEPAGAKHYVSKNASATQPAKLLVYMVLDEKDPVLTPLAK
ncbi:cupin domain-containing protein [Pseudomonas sp.]|uniref:cupin domain-containing protein n=1 Tax=Pseudomonas sp. TaxID=306 RepID=UPI0026186EE6|nr:cupin domain-containing protein [Pseudomonas sp.]